MVKMVKSKKLKEPISESETSGSTSESETSGAGASVGDPSSYETVSEDSSEESSGTSESDGSSVDDGEEEGSRGTKLKKCGKKVKKSRKKKKKNKVVTGSISTSAASAVGGNGNETTLNSNSNGNVVNSVKGQSSGRLSISRIKKSSLPFPPLKDLSGRYDKETNEKCQNVFNSILGLGEESKKYMNTLNTATKNAIEQSAKNMQILKHERKREEALSLGKDGLDKLESYFFDDETNEKSTRSGKKSRVDVSRIYPKLFGLDAMEVLDSDDDSGDEIEKVGQSNRSKSMSKKMNELRQILLNNEGSGDRQMQKLENIQPDKLFLKSLQRKENSVQKELQKMTKKVNVAEKKDERDGRKSAFEFNTKTSNPNRPPKQHARLMSSQPSEGPGRELTQFLQKTGGINGGWSKDEHNLFMKTLKAHRNNTNKVMSILTKKIPSLKGEEVVSHIDWYEKYEKLEQADKDFVRNWRIEKQKERELIFHMAKEDKKAALAARTRRAEELAVRRDSEKEKNRNKLEQWKESKRIMEHKLKEVLNGNVSVTDDPYGPNFPPLSLSSTTQSIRNNSALKLKLDQLSRPIGQHMDKRFNLDTVKREMERINDLTKQLRRVKTTSELTSMSGKSSPSSAGSYIERRGQLLSGGRGSGGAGDSYGLYPKAKSATALKSREYMHSNNAGKGDANEKLRITPRPKSSTSIGLFQTTKSDPILNKFRERDRKMMEARARAIQNSMDKKRVKPKSAFDANKKILLGKPSTLFEQTEGSKIREGEVQARLLERHSKFLLKTAAENSKNSKNGPSKIKGQKVHERAIIQPTNIFTIPRLGKPAWRSMN